MKTKPSRLSHNNLPFKAYRDKLWCIAVLLTVYFMQFLLIESEISQANAAESYQFVTKWGSQGTGDGQFNYPYGIAVNPSGNVHVTDTNNNRIQKFSSSGAFITKWGSYGTGDGQFDTPSGVAVDASGNVYVTDYYNNRIQKFSSGGTFITKWGSNGTGDGQFDWPDVIAVDASGNVYVLDLENNRVQKFNSIGTFITKWGVKGHRRRPVLLPTRSNSGFIR